MNVLDFVKNTITILDGGMGTLLQEKGLTAGTKPETWNMLHPDIIEDIHRAYFDAGSNIINANTFGANCLKFKDNELESVIKAAMENAKTPLLKALLRSRNLSPSI